MSPIYLRIKLARVSEIHIAEIGDLFINEDGFDFLSDQNMLEYDFIIIDSGSLIESINGNSLSKIKNRFSDLKDFISIKNIPVVFFCTSGGAFAEMSSKKGNSLYECLEIDVTEKSAVGKKIEVNNDTLFSDFLKRNVHNFDYNIGFATYPGISIGNAKSKTLSIGFYTKDYIFLPSIAEDTDYDESIFLNQLYEICRNIRKDQAEFHVSEWAMEYLLPGEKNEKEKLKNIEQEISHLNEERIKSENRLSTLLPLKQLWTASGTLLENAAKKVFEELGLLCYMLNQGETTSS